MRLQTSALALALAACTNAPDVKTEQLPLRLGPNVHVTSEGLLEFDSAISPDTPTTDLKKGEKQGWEFEGKAGGVVTIAMHGATCGAPDTFLFLFGPKDATGDRGRDLVHNDDADDDEDCALDSKIAYFELPVDGEYLIVASSFRELGGGRFTLTLTCDNGACAKDGAKTFVASRLAQADIEANMFSPEQVFENGDFLFEHNFRLEEGLGNALAGAPGGTHARPNMRDVHQGAFGAPEAHSCITCHNEGGDDGAGGNDRNIFQIGDGVNKATGLQRNPPHALGLGYREALAREMSTALAAQRDAAKTAAAQSGQSQTVELVAKGISFGTIIVAPDGTVDSTGLAGIDADLVVKPFGWKGRESLLRRFAEGGLRVHFGMQTVPSVNKHCANPNPNTFGTGANCQDPDDDGVVEEIVEGQLTSLGVYLAVLEAPVEIPGADAQDQATIEAGRQLFTQVGCATCHHPSLVLNKTSFVEPSDSGGPGFALDLTVDTHEPRPARTQDGLEVVSYSDFKRHDMGASLADSKPFNQIGAAQFMTTPLWGVADTAPYLHDGRAPTLKDAIIAHDGEGLAARNGFAALKPSEQAAVVRFLASLGRTGDTPPDPRVNLSGFSLQQTSTAATFTLPGGTFAPHGGYIVVARNADKAAFEAFWGVTLGLNVTFINTHDTLPHVNGFETFRFGNGGATLDGPTFAVGSDGHQNLQRVDGHAAAGVAGSWQIRSDAKANATPGSGQQASGDDPRIYISEISDAAGSGNFGFEFVEIFVE
jgi:di-heme oxidoreductase (putative peroxidase)